MPPIPPLSDVVRDVRHDNSRNSSHVEIIQGIHHMSIIKYAVPGIHRIHSAINPRIILVDFWPLMTMFPAVTEPEARILEAQPVQVFLFWAFFRGVFWHRFFQNIK